MLTKKNLKPGTQKISTRYNEIWIERDEILRVTPLNKDVEVDLEETKACFEAYRQLRCDKKVLQLIDATSGLTMTCEARDYASKHGKEYFIASAIISNSLPIRLTVNFFNLFYKHVVPFKVFITESEALSWLKTFQK